MLTQTNSQEVTISEGNSTSSFNFGHYLLSKIPNSIENVNGVVDPNSCYDVYGNYMEPTVHISCEKELNTKRRILQDLLTDNYDSEFYDFKLEKNNKYVRDIFTMFSKLPKLMPVSQTKPFEPIFAEIPVMKTDNVKITDFLRKMNLDFIGYYCNHNTLEEKCDKVYKSTEDLLKDEKFKRYKEFVERYVDIIYGIFIYFWRDLENKYEHESLRQKVVSDFTINFKEKTKIHNTICKLNLDIADINSRSNKRCSRCEAKQRLYEYTLREVQRMRDEQEEQETIDRKFDENDYDIQKFMQNNFPNVERLLLKDVQQRFTKEFGQKLTFAQLTEKLEQTGKYKITSVSRTMYVTKI